MMWRLGDPQLPDNPALVPEDDIDIPNCPICGSDSYEYLFYQNGECFGCDSCVKRMDIDEILMISREVLKL